LDLQNKLIEELANETRFLNSLMGIKETTEDSGPGGIVSAGSGGFETASSGADSDSD
jgi:hypothetical protein